MIRAALLMLAAATPLLAHPVEGVRFALEDGVTYSEGPVDRPFAIASVGKTLTAVAILRQVEAGRLQLDAPVAAHLPREVVRGLGGLRGVTLRQLLSMSSGLPEYYDALYLEDALADQDRVQRPQIAVRYAYGFESHFAPGTQFEYSNTNYLLLGLILEAVTGQSYAEAIGAEVLAPAGMASSRVFGAGPLPSDFVTGHEDGAHIRGYYEGHGFGDGGVIATAPDVAAFYQALFIDQILLGPPLMREMLKDPHGAGYGMGIEVEDGIYGHSGGDLGFAADARFNAETGAIAVELIADGAADPDWAYEFVTD
ncbi:MAG: serine hydrolase domain-containing protein [Pseudomonadota bacterium]